MLYDKRWDTKINTQIDEIGEILLKAADAIRKYGHTKNRREYAGAMCAHGALGFVMTGNAWDYHPKEKEVAARVVSYLKNKGIMTRLWSEYDMATWNNLPETTAQDVIDSLEGAARWQSTHT